MHRAKEKYRYIVGKNKTGTVAIARNSIFIQHMFRPQPPPRLSHISILYFFKSSSAVNYFIATPPLPALQRQLVQQEQNQQKRWE